MDIIFYKLQDEVNDVKKIRTLTATQTYVPITVSGTLRSATSKINPVIDFGKDVTYFNGWNYAYIADFNRYYFVDNPVSVRVGVTSLSFTVDVLTSFLTQTGASNCVGFVGRCNNSSLYEELLPDKRIQFKSKPIVTVSEPTSISGNVENITFSASPSDNVIVTTMNTEQFPTDVYSTSIDVPSPLRPIVKGIVSFSQWDLHPYGAMYGYVTDEYDTMQVGDHNISALQVFLIAVAEAQQHASSIASIRAYPFSLPKSTAKSDVYLLDQAIIDVRQGAGTSNKLQMYSSKYTNSGFLVLKDFTLSISSNNDFTDYEPYTKYELFIPFVGWTNINLKENYNDRLIVFYNIDYYSGQGNAYIYNATKQAMILQTAVQLGVDVPVTTSNMKENEIKDQNYTRNYITGMIASTASMVVGAGLMASGYGAPIGAGMMLGGATGIATGTMNYVNNENLLLDKGMIPVANSSGITGIYSGLKVLQRITKLQNVNKTADFKKQQGIPCNKIVRLGDIPVALDYHTYCEITDLHISSEDGTSYLDDITLSEIKELQLLCAQGIYI